LSENIIEVKGLTKKYGDFTAVNSINFNIKRGEILTLLGPNGAGKTTTIKMITGLLKISSGKIFLNGKDTTDTPDEIKKISGYMSQKFSLYPLLTPLENVEFFAGISGLKSKEIKEKKSELKKIVPENLLKIKVESLPPGVKQKIALFSALLSKPDILFLDEPTSGVDPEVRRDFWFEIYELKATGKTILVSTHNLDEVEFSDRVIILHRGEIILSGEPEKLLKEYNTNSFEGIFKEVIAENEKA